MASNDTDAMHLPLKQRIVELENQLSQCKAEIARLQSNVRQDETPGAGPRAGIHFDYQSLFANIAAVTTDAFIVVDADQRIHFFNSGAEKTFGYRAEEMIGQPLEVLLPERFADTHRIYFRGFAASPETSRMMGSRHEIRGRRRDGTLFPAEATISKVREGDDIVFVTVLRDITERKQAETEIRELTNDLERRVAERTAQLEVANAELQREIAERKQAEDALRHNEAHFRALIDNSSDAIALISAEGAVLYESPSVSRILGYAAGEFIGQNGFERIHPDEIQRVMNLFTQVIQSPGVSTTAQVRYQHKDSSWRWLEAVGTNLLAEPSVQAVVVNYRDITDRKRAERLLRVQHAVAQVLTESTTLKEATPRILQAVCQSLEWRLGELWLVDRQRDELRCSEIWHPPALALEGFEAASKERTFKRGIGLVGQVWASEEAAWVADVTHDANFVRSASATNAGLQSAFGFPLRGKNGILGVMVFLCHEVQQPDLDLLKVAFALGAQIGQFVERKRAEDALRKSEASLVAAQRIAHLGNWDWNIETNELLWSDEIYRMFGLAPQQFGATYEAFLNSVHPDDREYVIKSVDETLYERKPYDIEHRIVLSTGEVRIVNEQAEVVVNDVGRPIRMIGTVQDITERNQAEAALRESEERFRRLAENAVDVIYRYRFAPTRGFDYISRAITTISGYTPEEYYSDPDLVVKLVHPDDRHLAEAFRQSDTSSKQLISRWVRKDGSMIWMEHRAVSLFDAAGNMIAAEGIGRDITARMQAEDELRKLSSAIEQTEDMVVITDANGTTEYVNPAFEALTGFAREFAIGKTPAIIKSGKHSQEYYTQLWLTILAGQTFRGEIINRKKNGELFYEEKTITPLRNIEGKITHFVSTGKDITERKRAQQRFERHTLQLEALTDMGQIALASLDLETVLKNVVDEILALMRCEHIYVLLSENGDLVFAAVGGEGADALRGRHIPVYTGVAGQVMGNGHAVRMSSSMPHGSVFQEIAQASDQPVQTLLAAPLRLGSRLIGVVEAVHSDPDAFNEEDLRLLEAAASWASIAIHNAKQHETIWRRLQESEALASISRALNETVDLERILQMIVDAAQQIIPTVERTVIHLLDEEQRALRPVAVAGMHELGHPDFTMRTGEGVAGHAIAEGTVINVRDTHSDPRYLPLGTATHLRSLLVAPVQTGSRPLGTISVQSAAVNAFSADDEHLLMMLGIDAAIAIENARLFQVERRQREEAVALQQVTQAISSHLNLDRLLKSVVAALAEIAHYQFVCVYFLDKNGLRLMAQHGYQPGQPPALFPQGQGLISRVIQTGQPVLISDVRAEPEFVQIDPRVRSATEVPIIRSQQVSGVLTVETSAEQPLDQNDLNLLTGVSQQLSVALENAQLYSDLTRSLQQEQEMRAQLIQAAKLGALGRLTASLAHEINNPLQSVQGCLTLAREELDSQQRRDKMERYLGIAGTEIERISTIVRNMREFYRPARADLQLTDLHAILRSVLELSSKQLQHSNITFKRMWADDLPKIEANPDHLKQVFLNLVLNAVDSMPEGGTLSISTSRDEIRPGNGHPAQPAVKVQFNDTGKGMPPEVMSRVFEPFVTTKEHGSGLGLSISYRIIQSHNGQFSVASQEGKGSTFSILLPLQQPAAGDEPPLGD